MFRASFRQRAGAALIEVPRLAWALASRRAWIRYRNRNEQLTIDRPTGGARCDWFYTSDVHVARVFPRTGRRLLDAALRDRPILLADSRAAATQPKVSFVIGHRGPDRVPHLLAVLRSIAAQTAAVECIVVEQAHDPVLSSRLPQWIRYVHTPVAAAEPYNRSAAFNAGARVARCEILVFHDNDMLVPISYAAELLARRSEGFEFIDLKRFIFYASGEETKRITTSGSLGNHIVPDSIMQNARGGSIAAAADAFHSIGGFDEEFVGWGGEDNDFWDRAATRRTFAFGYLPFIHLWHDPQPGKREAQTGGTEGRYGVVKRITPEERIRNLLRKRTTDGSSSG